MRWDHYIDWFDGIDLVHDNPISDRLKETIKYDQLYYNPGRCNDKKLRVDILLSSLKFQPNRVIFNPPCTIVLWNDGSKTIARCGENDIFDPEKGLAIALAKRFIKVTKMMDLMDHAEYQKPKGEKK